MEYLDKSNYKIKETVRTASSILFF